MRLKQLLSIPVGMIMLAAVAYGTVAQLTGVTVSTSGESTVVTLKATGAFTHNEYRPDDKILLVDLAGVSSASLREKQKSMTGGALKSYRVLSYRGASGTEVTRVEFALSDSVSVNFSGEGSALTLRLMSNSQRTDASASAVPTVTSAAAVVPVTPAHTAAIRELSVLRTDGGAAVEIPGFSTAKVMQLENPQRLVLDFAGATPALRTRSITVNSPEIKGIRVARNQLTPPVTRVVIDLNRACNYELQPVNGSLVVKLSSKQTTMAVTKAPAVAVPVPAVAVVKPAAQTTVSASATVDVTPQSTPAKDGVLVASANPQTTPVRDSVANPVITTTTTSSQVEAQSSASPAPVYTALARNLAQQQREESAAAKPPATPKYTGEPISINVVDADVRQFFRLIHDISGLNIAVDPGVHGTVTLSLEDVPWDQALDIVLRNNNLDTQREGNVLRIASLEALKTEADLKAAQKQSLLLAQPVITVTRFLSYAKAAQVMPTLKNFMTKRGNITIDERTNALIISDIESVIADLDKLREQLDRKTQEVEIQARVVMATRQFENDMGVQLGLSGTAGSTTITGNPAVGTSSVSLLPLFSDLAASTATSGLALGATFGKFKLDAALSLAETRGLAKVISRPYVVAQNNMQSEVDQGMQIPYTTTQGTSTAATTTLVDAMLKLTVTPQITEEGTIFLDIKIENTSVDYSFEASSKVTQPALDTQKANTKVLVRDGETVMIGGVIVTKNSVSYSQVPVLGSIPYLGNLFKSHQIVTSNSELIFFITPRIIPI